MRTDVRSQLNEAYDEMRNAEIFPVTHAEYFHSMEEEDQWELGYCDHTDRKALVYIIEAASHMNGVDYRSALKLLRMAIDDLESRGQLDDRDY